ncbi:hypothetical protein AB0N20_27430 [Streptomyces griseoincarnatus]
MTTHLEVLGDDGEWHEIHGIASVELHQEQPEPSTELTPLQLYIQQYAPVRDAYIAFVKAYVEAARPVMEQLAQAVEVYGKALQDYQQARPVRRDRPAWQSPYGPARRRH